MVAAVTFSERGQVRAIAESVRQAIDSEVVGRVGLAELGDVGDPLIAITVRAADDETSHDIVRGIQRGLDRAPLLLRDLPMTPIDDIAFNQRKQSAIHQLFATLGDATERDQQLAAYALAGHDPRVALAAEIRGLRTLTRPIAADIARESFAFDRARIAVLRPAAQTDVAATTAELREPVHDRGIQHAMPDVREAREPAREIALTSLATATTRTLPNGLAVVLLPMSSVPAIDIRLVIGSGTADEPVAARGAALAAGHGLQWDVRHVNDLLAFAEGGGEGYVEVDLEHTTFHARGLDMHLDYLLAGMRRWVRDGTYGEDTAAIVDALRRAAKQLDDDGPVTDAWRAATYGASHPYTRAGLVRYVASGLGLKHIVDFRRTHYTPANATLVIAGRFDPAIANRWVDFLFADWQGAAVAKSHAPSAPSPATLAHDAPGAQIAMRLAIPALHGDGAARRVAAQMVSEIAGDVRHQLGASYDLDGTLAEARLATSYQVAGAIDAGRAGEALVLLRDRLDQLRSDGETAARAFVRARRRVLAQLGSASATRELAGRAQHAVAMARPPLSGLQLAEVVRALTIDGAMQALGDLDLARASILLRGPADEVDRAYAAIGRTPKRLVVTDAMRDAADSTLERTPHRTTTVDDDRIYPSEIEDALTLQVPPSRATLAVAATYGTGSIGTRGVDGFGVAVDAGLRLDDTKAIGVHASISALTGMYNVGSELLVDRRPIAIVPLSLGVWVQATAYDRLWGGAVLGLHLDRVTDDTEAPAWFPGVGIGLVGGIDVLRLDAHRVGMYLRLDTELASTTDYSSLNVGIAYRR